MTDEPANTWRVKWRREKRASARVVEFVAYTEAERYARSATVFPDDPVYGPVVQTELEHLEDGTWVRVHIQRLRDNRQGPPPERWRPNPWSAPSTGG